MTQISGAPAMPQMPNQIQQAHKEARNNPNASATHAASKEEVERKKRERPGASSLPPDLGRPIIANVQHDATEETSDAAAAKAPQDDIQIDAEEREILKEMSSNIKETSRKVAKGVNKSAFRHMKEKGWFKEEYVDDANAFFVVKIPSVQAEQMAKFLNETLGIDEAIG
jgi:hypothetical protein